MDPLDPLRNGKDPIHGTERDYALDLFREMGRIAANRPRYDVINAACNLLINAIRQGHGTWRSAEVAFNEQFGRSKQLLKNHYDMNGRKKGIFPYDQHIFAAFHIDQDRIRR